MRGARIKFGVIIVTTVLALWSLWPTYRLYFMMPGQEKALNDRLARALSADDSARVKVDMAEFQQQKTAVHKHALHLGLDLVGGMYLTLQVDKSKLTAEDAKDAGDRALEVIRNRVDQFGVMEPIIQKVGQDRILVQLPGVDRERAKTLIGQTAQLKFQLVQDERTTYDALKTLDDKLKSGPGADTGSKAVTDTAKKAKPDTSRLQALLDTTRKDTNPKVGGEAEAGTLLGLVRTIGGDFGVDDNEYPQFKLLLERARQYWPAGYEFQFGPSEVAEGSAIRRLYMLKAEPEMLGSAIKDARPSPYSGSEPGLANTWIVSLRLGRKDAAVFAQVTGRNIGRRLAIVLDGIVKSAPMIQTRIPDGNAMITTNNINPDESRDLSIVLRSGALPAPVNIIEERSVGASLGNDAIRRGIFAGLV